MTSEQTQTPVPSTHENEEFGFADVAVDVRTSPRKDAFTYAIPKGMNVLPGHLVRVPFGSHRAHGVVLKLTNELHVHYTKLIHSIVYPEPVVDAIRLKLAKWMSRYYRTSLFETIAPMLPPGFRTTGQTIVRLVNESPPAGTMSVSTRALLTYLGRHPNGIRMNTIERRLGSWALNSAQLLAEKEIIEISWAEPKPTEHRKYNQVVRLNCPPKTAHSWAAQHAIRSPQQASLMEYLAETTEPPLASNVRRYFGASVIQALVVKGLAHLEVLAPKTTPHPEGPGELSPLPTKAQAEALEVITTALDSQSASPKVFLLHGVTGSGKTEVYLQSLAHCLAAGNHGIMLVPELALTPQTLARVERRFPGKVGILHSGMTPRQQTTQWWGTQGNQVPIVIGSRGAIFAPQKNLGLIILDEEHEWTYKQQDASPRYHARDVAIHLAKITGAVVLLGSATPDLASTYLAHQGHYRILTLPHRIEASGASIPLADIEVVDMRQELREGNRSIFSQSLQNALEECLDSKHQAILFLNRRGSANVVQCRSCGFVVRCWRCVSPFTYHVGDRRDEAILICHHCNRRRGVPATCPQCRKGPIRYLGIGTQRVAEEVEHLIPSARVLRWDRDTASTVKKHQELLTQFANGEANILVGTQMIAKGLHVPNVTLVGVVLADFGLHVPDYRSGERTFQVLCQVAGRAGRGPSPGKVIIQSYVPDHYAIEAARQQDYDSFYRHEIAFRKAQRYPPIGKLVRLTFSHQDQAISRKEVFRVAAILRRAAREWGITHLDLIGPAPAYPPRLRNMWRWHLLLRGANPQMLLDKTLLPPRWVVDIDPVTTN